MKLIVHELDGTNIQQKISRPKKTIVAAIRPHIYRHLSPTGGLKLQIYQGVDLVAESETIAISSIAPGHNYFHGYVRFMIKAYLDQDIEYFVRLVGTDGYSFNESAYIGWCNDFDLSKYEPQEPSLIPADRPLDMEIWERRVK